MNRATILSKRAPLALQLGQLSRLRWTRIDDNPKKRIWPVQNERRKRNRIHSAPQYHEVTRAILANRSTRTSGTSNVLSSQRIMANVVKAANRTQPIVETNPAQFSSPGEFLRRLRKRFFEKCLPGGKIYAVHFVQILYDMKVIPKEVRVEDVVDRMMKRGWYYCWEMLLLADPVCLSVCLSDGLGPSAPASSPRRIGA